MQSFVFPFFFRCLLFAFISVQRKLFLNKDLISKHQFVSPSLDATRLENIAKFRPASQSSFTDEDASKAVDGKLDTCANTTMETNPWWSVDLGKDVWVEKIRISTKNKTNYLDIRIGKPSI